MPLSQFVPRRTAARPDASSLPDRQARIRANGPGGLLANRVLVHARPRGSPGCFPPSTSATVGLMLCGDKPEQGIKRCRKAGFEGILAIDPRGYEDGPATPEAPFTLSADDQLFEPSLEQVWTISERQARMSP